MFQNVLMTGLTTPLCNTDEVTSWDNRPFEKVWPESQQTSNPHHTLINKATEIKRTIRKKPKRVRTAFTTDQLRTLEKTYLRSRYIDGEKRRQLADQLNMNDKCIKVWFQNRRMKQKRDSESSYDSSTESSSVATSPPLNNEQNLDINDVKVESSNLPYPAQLNSFEPPQYQVEPPQYQIEPSQYQVAPAHYQVVPHFQYDNQTHFHVAPTVIPQSFYYDPNVYPTEYYPYAAECNNATQLYEQNSWFNLDEFNCNNY